MYQYHSHSLLTRRLPVKIEVNNPFVDVNNGENPGIFFKLGKYIGTPECRVYAPYFGQPAANLSSTEQRRLQLRYLAGLDILA